VAACRVAAVVGQLPHARRLDRVERAFQTLPERYLGADSDFGEAVLPLVLCGPLLPESALRYWRSIVATARAAAPS
jgi:hypothetical protein